MSLWDRVKVMLGLADDYDEYEDDYEGSPAGEEPESSTYRSPYASATPGVRRVNREPDLERAREAAHVRSVSRPAGESRGSVSEFSRPSERYGQRLADVSRESGQSSPNVKVHIVEPRSFAEAQGIGDMFKSGTPVIMNLTSANADVAKRMLDFASGLTYGLDGGLQKVSERVFMLTPANVDVSAADRRRLKDKGLFTIDS